ncbi:MAG: hypothetical protein V3S31_04450, partial [Dehalococcoidia bacterium]
LGFEGTDFLSGDSPRSLIEFWDVVGRGTPWEQVFPDVFGATPERFYEAFEAYRLQDPRNPTHPDQSFRIELLPRPFPAWFPESSDSVTYLFQVYGVNLNSGEIDLPDFPIIAVPYAGPGGRWGMISTRNLIFKLIPKTALPGTVFEVTFTLGDGRSASTSFTHR